jgi:hypothetical protein
MSLKEKGQANDFESINQQRLNSRKEIRKLEFEIRGLNEMRMAHYYNLDEETYLYYKQLLVSKGLLMDSHNGAMIGGGPYMYMIITEFGKRLIEFIKRE